MIYEQVNICSHNKSMIYEQVFISPDDWTVHMNTCSYVGSQNARPCWAGCKVKSLYSFDSYDNLAFGVLVDCGKFFQRGNYGGKGVLSVD